MTRTIEQSLARAQNLRDWRKSNQVGVEKVSDYQDIILLADEVERLKARRILSESVERIQFSAEDTSAILFSTTDDVTNHIADNEFTVSPHNE